MLPVRFGTQVALYLLPKPVMCLEGYVHYGSKIFTFDQSTVSCFPYFSHSVNCIRDKVLKFLQSMKNNCSLKVFDRSHALQTHMVASHSVYS